MKNRPRRFCLEVFAGTARVSQALQNVGIAAFPVDTCIYPSHNVLTGDIAMGIFNFLRNGRVKMVWLGMPCTTFSRARRNDGLGPPPLRTSSYLWGLPDLRPSDQRKLEDGNQLFRFTMKVLSICEQLHIPYILENPLTSMAWEMQPLVDFCAQHQPCICDLDFCMYGEQWLKPTRLLYNYIDISQLSLRCSGPYSRCCQTNRPHRALRGTDSNGVFWTLRAQPYPLRMVQKFAEIMAKALRDTAR